MAKILLHTTSIEKSLQEQAITLQNELQLLGHDVDFSTATHPFRILKNQYDIFHVISESDHLSLKDATLLLMAKINRTATVLTTYGLPRGKVRSIYQRIQATAVDAFSCSNVESLKLNKIFQKIQLKQSLILPMLPQLKIKKTTHSETQTLKIISQSLNELKLNKSNIDSLINKEFIVDASLLLKKMTASEARKVWSKFQSQNPAYQNCILLLKFEDSVDLIKSNNVILDLSNITDGIQFHAYFELAYAHRQFTILTASQASGFPNYWIHQQNCWISDFKNSKKLSQVVEKTQSTLAQAFFKSSETLTLDSSFENKINELSRTYAKIISQKNLAYVSNRALS